MKRRSPRDLIINFVVLVCIFVVGNFAVRIIAAPAVDQNSFLLDVIVDKSPPLVGWLPPSWMLARADKSDVGTTVTLSFPQLLEETQFDEQSQIYGNEPELLHIAYLYNTKENTGRLAILTEKADNGWICCLTIYEPEWAGGEALCENLTQPFQAKIIHRVNINRAEGMLFFSEMMRGDATEDPTVIIDTSAYQTPAQPPEVQCFYGKIYYCEEGSSGAEYLLQDNIAARIQCSALLPKEQRSSSVFLRIVEDYGLNEYMGID